MDGYASTKLVHSVPHTSKNLDEVVQVAHLNLTFDSTLAGGGKALLRAERECIRDLLTIFFDKFDD